MKNIGYNKTCFDIKYKSYIDGKEAKVHKTWKNILIRCYDPKYRNRYPTYKDCTIDESWLNYQVFAKWYYANYKEGFCLDKDILIKGNKHYSPNTCCFVPQEINKIFTIKPKGRYLIGVIKRDSRYQAYINKYNKNTYIGSYDTPEEASQAYIIVKEKHIKEIADKYKDVITDPVYNALYNYRITMHT